MSQKCQKIMYVYSTIFKLLYLSLNLGSKSKSKQKSSSGNKWVPHLCRFRHLLQKEAELTMSQNDHDHYMI